MIEIFALSISLLSAFFFIKLLMGKGFSLPIEARKPLDSHLKFRHFLAALATWFFCQVIVTSFFNTLALQETLKLDFRQWFCFMNFFTNFTIMCCLLAIISWRNLLLLGKGNAFYTGAYYGIAIQLPIVLSMCLIQYVVDAFGQFPRGQELAGNLLHECQALPWLYAMTFFAFAVFCPIVEELIFRGFLQNWLVARLGAFFGILLTSVFFASVHYSSEQGAANIELLLAIFALSSVFGIVYFKTRSITGSIGMHITNNIIALVLQ